MNQNFLLAILIETAFKNRNITVKIIEKIIRRAND